MRPSLSRQLAGNKDRGNKPGPPQAEFFRLFNGMGTSFPSIFMSEKPRSDPFLRIIAVFKLAKAVLFLGAGIGLLQFLNKDVESRLQNLMASLHVDADNHIAKWCLQQAGQLTNTKLESLSAICFFYAVLFATEGVGLYLRKRWAEYFVVIVTGSLLPLEGYEIWHKVTWAKILLTMGNLMILSYLIYVIRRNRKT
jgi:uncharacterized membrane protein (DUF2068 family)